MPIITLISDWGLRDHYAGAVKGAILKSDPGITIVDITHQIKPFDILQAAFVLRNTFLNYPEGSVHIMGVNSDETDASFHIAVLYEGHFFVGTDNGIFSLAFDRAAEKIICIDVIYDSNYHTFPVRDRFAKAAVHLATGKPIGELGFELEALQEKFNFRPVVEKSLIIGKVIYIDAYENLFVNITKELFDRVRQQRDFNILIRNREYRIDSISTAYNDVPPGNELALFGSTGYLEIAINQGNAAGLMGIEPDDNIRIEFYEKSEPKENTLF
jgi:S-adenosyl-L-methionine hydrolase (adenosine-forming)